MYIILFSALFIVANANKNTQVGVNHLNGDQTVGGLHFFEFHAPNGGTGIGFKIIAAGLLICALLYWCIKRKTKNALRRYGLIPTATTALQQLALQQLPTVQTPHAPAPVHRAPYARDRSTRVGPLRDEDVEDF